MQIHKSSKRHQVQGRRHFKIIHALCLVLSDTQKLFLMRFDAHAVCMCKKFRLYAVINKRIRKANIF